MPNFPRAKSTAQLTTQTPSLQAPEDTTGAILEQTAKVGQQVQETALKWSNAVDTIQKTTAQANFKSGMLDITNRAQNDPDYNNSDQYFKEIEKLKTDNLKGFSSKTTETQAAIEFGYEAKVGQIQIQNLYKKKMIDVGRAGAKRFLDVLIQNPNSNTQDDIKENLSYWKDNLLFSDEETQELEKSYGKTAKYNSFLIDLNQDISSAGKKLSKNLYGFDVKELESAKKILENGKKEFQEELETAQIETAVGFAQKVADDVSPAELIQELDQARKSKLITQTDYDFFSKSITTKNPRQSDSKVEIDLDEKYLKAMIDGNPNDVREFMLNVLASKGKLSKNSFNYYLKRTDPNFVELQKPKAKEMWAGFRFIKNYFSDYTPLGVGAKLISEFLKKAQESSVPPSAVPGLARDVVRSDALQRNPDLVGKEDLTNLSMTRSDGAKQVYPGDTKGNSNFKGKINPPDPAILKLGDVTQINGIYYRVIGEDPASPDYLEKINA